MDPEMYRSMTTFSRPPAPHISVDEQPLQRPDEQSGQDGPLDTSWSVDSPNITRGNLGHTVNIGSNDPRMEFGWKANAVTQNDKAVPWMLPRLEQSFMSSWESEWTDNASTPRNLDQTSNYPHPSLSLPHPSLSLDFRMSVLLNPKISVGPTPFGHRNWISFTGGTWSGSWGSGIVLPGGQDSQLIIADGSARLETNYILQTYDNPPAHIVVKTHGWRTGPQAVLKQLDDPELADKVDPNSYKFRLFVDMETGDERYRDKVNCGMWVGSGMRKGAEVVYDAYRVS